MPSSTPTAASIALTPIRSWRLISGAIRAHDEAELAALLAEGADPNARENPRRSSPTPLYLACQEGSAQAVEALLKAGAKPDALSRGAGCLWAQEGVLQNAASAVLEQAFRDPRQDEASRAAASLKMKALINAGLSPEAPTAKGQTVWADLLRWEGLPLQIALPWIQAGADIDAFDENERTLLFNAVCHGNAADARLLLELGADPFKPCCSGRFSPAEAAAAYAKSAPTEISLLFEALSQRRDLDQASPSAPPRPAPSL